MPRLSGRICLFLALPVFFLTRQTCTIQVEEKMKKLFSLCLLLCLVMSLPLFAEDVAYDAQALDFIE